MNHTFEEDPLRRKERKEAKKIASRKDRSKYKKTDLIKRKRLLQEKTQAKLKEKEYLKGRVLSITLEGILVDYENVTYICSLRGSLKKETSRLKNLITVGDLVFFEKSGEKEGSIVSIEERSSVLARQDPFYKDKEQLIAANVDYVLITLSVASPPLNPPSIDKYVIATTKGKMQPIIVINKCDLLKKGSEEEKKVFEIVSLYKTLQTLVILVSVFTREGLEKLMQVMQKKTSVFAGESGVGKSSLINALTGLNLITGDIGKKSKRGVHTTTRAQLLPLDFGGWCIDTPGIQLFNLMKVTKDDLFIYFSEITEVGKKCKFQDCLHRHEPECAVLKALNENKILKIRYDSFQKLLEECC